MARRVRKRQVHCVVRDPVAIQTAVVGEYQHMCILAGITGEDNCACCSRCWILEASRTWAIVTLLALDAAVTGCQLMPATHFDPPPGDHVLSTE